MVDWNEELTPSPVLRRPLYPLLGEVLQEEGAVVIRGTSSLSLPPSLALGSARLSALTIPTLRAFQPRPQGQLPFRHPFQCQPDALESTAESDGV